MYNELISTGKSLLDLVTNKLLLDIKIDNPLIVIVNKIDNEYLIW